MADATDKFAIRTVPPVGGFAGNWTPIVAGTDCRRIVIRNNDGTNAVLLRTDFADPNTQDSLPASSEYTIQISDPVTYFKAGTVVAFFQPAAGSVALTVKSYR